MYLYKKPNTPALLYEHDAANFVPLYMPPLIAGDPKSTLILVVSQSQFRSLLVSTALTAHVFLM